MSEKRYDTRNDNTITDRGPSDDYIVDLSTGKEVYHPNDTCDLLNEQAETIEVLREWILNTPINDGFDSIDDFERKLIRIHSEGGCGGMEERVELAKRRIAALEGK